MNKRIPIVLGFILLAIALWLQTTSLESVTRFITRLEDLAYDVQLRTKILTHAKSFQTSIAIVDIDDKSLSAEGRWPWARAKLATLINVLHEEGAVVVAFDIIFPEKETNISDELFQEILKEKLTNPSVVSLINKIRPQFNNDAKLAESLTHIDVVLGISFTPTPSVSGVLSSPWFTLTTPQEKLLGFINAPGVIGDIPELLSSAKNSGFINVFPDEDGIIRQVPILIRYHDDVYPSLALEAVRLFFFSKVKLITAEYNNQLRLEGVKIGNYTIPTDEKGQVIIPFQGKSFSFPFYSATDVLNKKIAPNALEGKIVFIGSSATGLGDLKATAIQNIFPGVEIQATIADGILKNIFPYHPAWALGAELSLTSALGIIFIFIFPYLGPRILTLFIVFIPLVLIFANNFLWVKTGLIISVFIPMSLSVILALANMIYGYLFETRRREQLKEMFGQYVPAKHIDAMLKKTVNFALQGESREMTVLFADIRNFTLISEPLTAAKVTELLNNFFTHMTEIIFKHHGTIDKYVGDLIMAFWGAPLKEKHHAQYALCAALEMKAKIEDLKHIYAAKEWPEISIGIGINTGEMSVGDMGSKFRRNYTVLGDSVNLASRIEGLTKQYGVTIIVGEATQKNQKKFVFRQLDKVRVKGKKTGIAIYEVLCKVTDATSELLNEVTFYHKGLDFYFSQQWDNALEIFTQLSQAHPDNKLYNLYLKRCNEFKQISPPDDWDGIYTYLTK